MKPVFAIPLFLLALPMVAAETPMSYVRVIESYSPSRSEPAAFFRHGARHDHLLRWAGTPGGAGGDGAAGGGFFTKDDSVRFYDPLLMRFTTPLRLSVSENKMD